MKNLIQWAREHTPIKNVCPRRPIDLLQPLQLPAADAADQAVIDRYNGLMKDVQSARAGVTMKQDGTAELKCDTTTVLMSPNGFISFNSRSVVPGGWASKEMSFFPRPYGGLQFFITYKGNSPESGYRADSRSSELRPENGKLVDRDAFKPACDMLDLPTAADPVAAAFLEQYRDGVTRVIQARPGRYETSHRGDSTTLSTTSSPDLRTFIESKESPSRTHTWQLSANGSLRLSDSSWCGWGTAVENVTGVHFQRRMDGSLEVTKTGRSHRETTFERDFLTRPAPIVDLGSSKLPTQRWIISADGHATQG